MKLNPKYCVHKRSNQRSKSHVAHKKVYLNVLKSVMTRILTADDDNNDKN